MLGLFDSQDFLIQNTALGERGYVEHGSRYLSAACIPFNRPVKMYFNTTRLRMDVKSPAQEHSAITIDDEEVIDFRYLLLTRCRPQRGLLHHG